MTNEDSINTNRILLEYVKDIVIGSTTPPSSMTTYWIGNPGIYFVKSLMDDPLNSFLAYLFTTDKNLNSGTFGVFKMDFTPTSFKYVYTTLSMSSGSSFTVNCIA